MRHRKSGRKLKRTASHRRALLANLCTSLLRHKRIVTTVAKAKETRMLVEKMITRAKHAAVEGTTPAAAVHARREVGRMVKDRTVIKELFTTITEKVATRPGGYTRIVRLGQRPGDGAEVAVLELVDFNTGQAAPEKTPAPAKKKKAATRPRNKKASPKTEEAAAGKPGKSEKKK
jgi:large subunit ribosomal protein L17